MGQYLWAKMIVPVGPGGYEPGFDVRQPGYVEMPRPGGFVTLEVNTDLSQCTAADQAFVYELLEACLQQCRTVPPLAVDRSGPEPGDDGP